MFLRDKDLKREIWDGERLGIIDAPKTLKLDNAFNIKQIQNQLLQLINTNSTVYFDAKPCEFDTKLPLYSMSTILKVCKILYLKCD
jgi:Xaa-Pro aminopeptidase